MLLKGFELCCPMCRGDLQDRQTELLCQSCSHKFPVVFGIPDLRVVPDPYIDLASERAKIARLLERYDQSTFRQLIEFYYQITAAVPDRHARMFMRGLLSAEARSRNALNCWDTHRAQQGSVGDTLLEIGCGSGPGLVAAAAKYKRVIGTDIALRWLIVAKRRLADAGLDVPLVCACAEALPFREQVFDTVVSESVLEVVADQRKAVAETHRVMKQHGYLYISTPNRFSLGPDPHTGIWAGGYLPKNWVARYVRSIGGAPPRRSLLTQRTLRQLLVSAEFSAPRIWLPAIADDQRAALSPTIRKLIDLYMALRVQPLTRQLLNRVGPLFYAVAERGTR